MDRQTDNINISIYEKNSILKRLKCNFYISLPKEI